ncbi:hypothetical protein CSB45_04280 [candidate division KSB3 bacterium]|uniref:Glycosyltransferase family 1 protein n=1 Tax=candidate division KSB3 bacterium TaxID=2044937 RepID=A0A2G6E874_9BACT|nr:MAG: hypothetical protein CSB45_04280 [candidate division KSB3 bacterium]PIE30595.1 MAG: hypothetical protein CSA57_02865 [candidate division KSB3 bacterium]
MKKAKILYVNHVSYLGGAEIALVNFLSRCNRARYEPVVLAPEGALTQELDAIDIRCEAIPVLPGLNRYTAMRVLHRMPLLWEKARHEQPDLIHGNTNFAALYSGILGQLLQIPSLGHIRDIETLGRLGRPLIRKNSALIAISKAVERYLLHEQMPPAKIHRIYDGVDLQSYANSAELRKEGSSGPVIGIVGQIGSRKGHIFLLEALRDLVTDFPALKLWIVGVEPEHSTEHSTQQLRDAIMHWKLQDHVTFWGFRSDIPDMLRQLDVLALPSLQEPFGKIVIEAMAIGTAVVASRVGGVPEIVEDRKSGLLVPPADAAALRDALALLLSDAELRLKIGLAGQQRVRTHFSIQRNVAGTEAVYEKLLQARKTELNDH